MILQNYLNFNWTDFFIFVLVRHPVTLNFSVF